MSIAVHKKRPSRNALMVIAALLAALAGGAYYATRTQAVTAAGMPSSTPSPAAYGSLLDNAPPAAAPMQAGSHDPQRPADIDATEWQQLLDGLRNHPQRDQEIKRVVGYMRFKHDLDRWTALKNQPNAVERAQIGQKILDALPVRFANQEVTGPEALMLQSAIYADMIPDEAQRRPMEEAARQALMRSLEHDSAMQAKLQAEDEQTANFKAREAEVMKRFKDQIIDQSQMEKELDAARVASFK